jgi:hypothetical protein
MNDFENSGIQLGPGLGEMKNDYGDDCYITEAIFLDQKKYLLRKVSPDGKGGFKETTSTKFLGLGGKLNEQLMCSDFGKLYNKEQEYQMLFNFYNEMHDNPSKSFRVMRDFWKRNADNVFIVDKEVKASCNPLKRGDRIVHSVSASMPCSQSRCIELYDRSAEDSLCIDYYQFQSIKYSKHLGDLSDEYPMQNESSLNCTEIGCIQLSNEQRSLSVPEGIMIDYELCRRPEYRYTNLNWIDPSYGKCIKSGIGIQFPDTRIKCGWVKDNTMKSSKLTTTYCIGTVDEKLWYILYHRLESVKNGVDIQEKKRYSHINKDNYAFTVGNYMYFHVFYYSCVFGPTIPADKGFTTTNVHPLIHVNEYNVCKFTIDDPELWCLYEDKFVKT